MAVYRTSALFYDRFTAVPGGGVEYCNGGTADQIRVIQEITVYWNLTAARMQFSDADSTITLLNLSDSRRYNLQGFAAGDTFDVVDTASNDGSYTIDTISTDGTVITITGAPGTFTDEVAESCSVHGTTPITALDYLFNLVPNGAVPTYVSSTDTVTQRFTFSGLDASDVVTQHNGFCGTKSQAWVTSNVVTAATGETDECRVRGAGIADYVQSFTIVHIFYVSPIWLPELFFNYDTEVAPGFFSNGNALKYVCQFGAKFNSISPIAPHTGSFENIGYGAWLDEGRQGKIPGYSVTSIAYENAATGAPMDRIDVSIPTRVTMNINSVSGVFAATASRVITLFYVCPLNIAVLQNTPGSTLLQNIFLDSADATEGMLPINGENFGTAYQSITDNSVTFADPENMTVEFVFDPGSGLVTYLQNLSDEERYYAIVLATQDPAVSDTAQSDRVNCLADFQSADYDKTNDTLFEFTGSGLYAYEYPDSENAGVGSIEGFAGDPWVVKVPFKVDMGASVKEITFAVVCKKTGRTDYYLEEKIFDCTQYKKLLDVQQLIASETRGFVTYSGDPFNAVTLERDAPNDTAGFAAYIASYALVLRYESWISAEPQPGNRSDGTTPEIALDIETLNQNWANYSGVEGWDIYFQFTCTVTDVDGTDNKFISEIPITVYGSANIDWSGATGALTQETQYFVWEDETEGEEILSISKTGETLVRHTINGDFPIPVTATNYYGWLRATLPIGSIFDSRFASSEVESEDVSPWRLTPVDPLADDSIANGNARINVYLGTAVVIESIFDASIYGSDSETLNIIPRIGARYVTT